MIGALLLTGMLHVPGESECGAYSGHHAFSCPVMTAVPPLPGPDEQGPRPALGDPPPSFSWLDHSGDWTTPARDQGNCGSCWACAALGALESIINLREGFPSLDPDLSEQYILSCLPYAGGCSGGSPYAAFYAIQSTHSEGNGCNGVVTESCFPYRASDGIPCGAKCADWEEHLVPITDYGYWNTDGSPQDRARIKTQVMEEGPVVTYMLATEEFTEWGLTHHQATDYFAYPGPVSGHNHCVLIVGWQDDPTVGRGGYWICKNSWGPYFGYNGFFNIEYGSLNIDTQGIVWADYDPASVDWPPAADAGGPYRASVGQTLSCDGSHTRDDGAVVSWEWDFGDGTIAQGMQVTHTYEERGVYPVTLTVTDDAGQEAREITTAFISAWQPGDTWTYTLDEIFLPLEEELGARVEARVERLRFMADGEGLSFRGRIKGEVTLTSPLSAQARLLLVFADGSLEVDEMLRVSGAQVRIRGLMTVSFDELPVPLPVPFIVQATASLDSPLHLLPPSLEAGETWHTPRTTVRVSGEASTLLGLLRYPFSFTLSLGAVPVVCHGLETVNVEAGSFQAHRLSYLDMLDLYYAPSVATVVKADGSYDDSRVSGELTDVEYEE